jgi:hypothetical protein
LKEKGIRKMKVEDRRREGRKLVLTADPLHFQCKRVYVFY